MAIKKIHGLKSTGICLMHISNKDNLEVERGWTRAMLHSMTRAMILDTVDSNGCMCPKFGGQNGDTDMAAH